MKIGLEIHVQLPTRSKLFCSCPTTARSRTPRSARPAWASLARGQSSTARRWRWRWRSPASWTASIAAEIWFSRKTYFYPDLPKNFQITQYDSPLGTDGHFDRERQAR